MTPDEVLDVLAEQQDSLNWLANDGRQHFADARLSVFRSDEHFAVFTEFPHFLYNADEFTNWLGCAGDCLVGGAYHSQYEPPNLPILEELPDAPLWRENEYTSWLGNRAAFSVLVQGKRTDFKPTPEDYAKAGIVFKDDKSGENSINPAQLMHFVAVALDHPFFLSEDELRALIQPQFEPEMSLLLQTGDWQHPEPIFEHAEEDDWVDNIPCWQILSRAIVSGDAREWNAQDKSAFNTSWQGLESIYHENNDGYRFD